MRPIVLPVPRWQPGSTSTTRDPLDRVCSQALRSLLNRNTPDSPPVKAGKFLDIQMQVQKV